VTVTEIPSIAVKCLFFDVASEKTSLVKGGRNPFRDRRVREAIHLGIDRGKLTAGLPVPASPALQLVPPFIFGYNNSLKPAQPDPARARTLLAQAGFPDGFEVTFHARRILADGAIAIRDQLAMIGIKANLELLSEEDFFAVTRQRPEFAMALTRFGCPTGDAANLFDAVLHTPEPDKGFGIVNSGGYANPEMDKLVEDAARRLEPGSRRPVLERIMEIAMKELPWIPLYVDRDVYVHEEDLVWQPRMDNYVIVSEIGIR
jgi:peptide/nickel transport system substrate-binding protein